MFLSFSGSVCLANGNNWHIGETSFAEKSGTYLARHMIIPQVSSAALRLFPLGVLKTKKRGTSMVTDPVFPLLPHEKALGTGCACSLLLHELTTPLSTVQSSLMYSCFKPRAGKKPLPLASSFPAEGPPLQKHIWLLSTQTLTSPKAEKCLI